MTNKQFHDEILRQGNMPIALDPARRHARRSSRATWPIDWKFYGDNPAN